MTKMTVDEVGAAIAALISGNADGNEDSTYRKEALDYYYMRQRGDEVQGRSQVVSGDLSAMTEAVLSQMLDAFTTDNAIEFEPSSQEDEQQAQLESDTVSYLVMEANNGYITFAQAIKDALLLRNGINKIWVDEEVTVTETEYARVEPEAFVQLTQGTDDTVIDVLDYTDDILKIRTTKTARGLRVQPVPIENFMVTAGWNKLDLQEVPFCAEVKAETRSSLIEQGFPKKTVNAMAADSVSRIAENARNPKSANPTETVPDTSQEIIEVHECYVLMDVDGDGISERRRILYGGGEVMANDIVDIVPYAAGSVFVAPHRFQGISLHDKLKQVQDISTGLNRALLDNANATNKSRIVYVEGEVDMDSLEDGRVNGLIGCKGSTENVKPLMVPDISGGILQNINQQKITRGEMGGASLELASGQAQLGSNQVGSEGLDRAYSVMEQLAAMMAKNVAETLVKQTFLIAHATLRTHFDTPVNIRIGGKWQSAIPSEWVPRVRMNVKIGMSAGERNRKIAALNAVVEKQTFLAQQGLDGVLVNIENFYNANIDLARASEVDNPERYFMDPASDESKATAEQKSQQAAILEEKEAQILSMALELQENEVLLGKYKADQDTQFKYAKLEGDLEVEEAKIVGAATKDLMNVQERAKAKTVGRPKTRPAKAGRSPVEEQISPDTVPGERVADNESVANGEER